MPNSSRKKVALLVRTGNDWSRQVLMGVAQFAHEQGGWNFTHPKADDRGEVLLPSNWKGDGIICRLTSEKLRTQILDSKIPSVNVSWLGKHQPSIVKVVSDELACGKTVSEYFLERQFRNFGFVGSPDWQKYDSRLAESIESFLEPRQLKLSKFRFPTRKQHDEQLRQELQKWLMKLEKPIALVVWSSEIGRIITSICVDLRISIPNSVSILCIEHDDLASSLSSIPLSNVDQDAWRVGYTAACTMGKLMDGESPPTKAISVPPLAIVQRRSSEASAVDDETVRESFRFIHERVTDGLNVDDVVREMGVSRRTLEKKFHTYLKLSPAQVIRRARLSVVKRLLRETTLTVPQIAARSGFSHPEVLIRAFKRDTGLTPTQFRSASL